MRSNLHHCRQASCPADPGPAIAPGAKLRRQRCDAGSEPGSARQAQLAVQPAQEVHEGAGRRGSVGQKGGGTIEHGGQQHGAGAAAHGGGGVEGGGHAVQRHKHVLHAACGGSGIKQASRGLLLSGAAGAGRKGRLEHNRHPA